jgi:hypothetical protein
VIENAGHYFGTGVVEDNGIKEWRTTSPEVFGSLVNAMDSWLMTTAAGNLVE